MFPPNNLPSPGELLLITDELPSPADFLIHRSLSSHLKEHKNNKCIVLSVSEDFARWRSIAAKSNLNLSQSPTSESLVFVDVLKSIPPPLAESVATTPHFRSVITIASAALQEWNADEGSSCLVVLDDISSLEWIGYPALDVFRFARVLRTLCLKFNASLIIRHHIVNPAHLDELFRQLLQICSYHIEVRPLSSGKSGAVSGEVSLHLGPSMRETEHSLTSRSVAVQYRLTDYGSVFFQRGTSWGVL